MRPRLAAWLLLLVLAVTARAERLALAIRTPGDLAHAVAARALLRRRGIGIDAPGFVGRAIRCAPGAACDRWDAHAERRLVFFFGADGLDLLVRARTDREFLSALGYPDAFLREQVKLGTRFELVALRAGPLGALPGTWDGLARMVRRAHGDAMGDRIDAALPALKAHDPAAWTVREWLARVDDVNALYAGDGFTRRPDGTRGTSEMVAPNGPIPVGAGIVRAVLNEGFALDPALRSQAPLRAAARRR